MAGWVMRPKPMMRRLHERYGDVFTLRLLLFTALVGFLVLPYQAFLPAFARDVLLTGADGLALLVTSVGAGAVLGALLSSWRVVEARPNAAMATFALAVTACQPAEGPVERAGKQLDQAVERVGDQVDDAAERAKKKG